LPADDTSFEKPIQRVPLLSQPTENAHPIPISFVDPA
jgi:hypothetical protein